MARPNHRESKIFRRALKWVGFLLFLCLTTIVFWLGRNVDYTEQAGLYEGLRTTSGIVFGIMGAWIAIVHPGSLGDFFEDKKTASEQMLRLMSTMVISAFVLASILLINLMVPVLRQIPLFSRYELLFNGISYVGIFVLTMLQIWSLLLTLLPNYLLKEDLKRAEAKERMGHHFTGKR
jgi:magnesium-transporting ATPase (P-type)